MRFVSRIHSRVRRARAREGAGLAWILGLVLGMPTGQAQQTLYWDANGAGTVAGGTGEWNTTSARWSTEYNGTTYQPWNNFTYDSANFLTGSGTVTLTAPITAQSLFFASTGNYTIAGAFPLTLVDAGSVNAAYIRVDDSTATINVPIAGNDGLAKAGVGTLVLNGANTFTGYLDVRQGTLKLGANSSLSAEASVIVRSGATFDIAAGDRSIGSLDGYGNVVLGARTLTTSATGNTTYAGEISGSGNLIKTNWFGTLSLTGTNTYTGTTTVADGKLQIGDGGTTGSIASTNVAVSANATLIFNRSNNLTYNGVISGEGGLTKLGAGTLTLNGTHTYTGTTNVAAGTLKIGNGGIANGNVIVGGGAVIDFSLGSETIGPLSGTGNAVLGSSHVTVTVNGTNAASTFSGNISGTGNFSKTGEGTLTLDGTNAYTGITTVEQGTLQVGAGGATGSIAASGNIVVSSGATLVFNRSDNFAYTGVISGEGGLTKLGTGTFTLNGAHTYTGTTNVAAGTLKIGSGGIANGNVIVGGGAVLDFSLGNEAIGPLSGTGGVVLGASNVTVTVNGTDAPSTFSGNISGAGNFAKFGEGTQTLDHTSTYTGITTVDQGTLQIGAGGSTGSIASSSNIVVASGATVTFNRTGTEVHPGVISGAGNLTKAGTGTLALTGTSNLTGNVIVSAGTLQFGNGGATGSFSTRPTIEVASGAALAFNRSDDVVANIAITGDGGLTKLGSGSLKLDPGQAYAGHAGTTNILAGTLIMSEAWWATGPVNVAAGATLDFTQTARGIGPLSGSGNVLVQGSSFGTSVTTATTFSGNISGNGGFSKNGPGTLTLDTTQAYTGTTDIGGGTLQIGAGGGTGSIAASSNIVVASGATLAFNRTGTEVHPGAISGAGNLTKAGAGTLVLTGTGNLTGSANITAGTLQIGNGGTTGSLAAPSITVGAGETLVFNRSDDIAASATSIAGAGNVTKTGAGTLTLNGTGGYSGATTVSAGTLALGASNVIPDGSAVVLTNAAGVSLNLAGFSDAIGSLSGGGANGGGVALGSGTLTVGNATSTTYSGNISGAGNLTKAGGGTLTLNGTNTYAGTTNITAGTLRLGSGGTLAATSAVVLANTSGAALDLDGNARTIGSLSGGGASGGNIGLGSGTLTVGNTSTTTFAGVISGGGNLIKTGTGTLTLDGSNTYTGMTTVSQGTLALGANGRLHNASALTVAGGIFSLGAVSTTVNGVTVDGGTVTGTSGTLTSTTAFDVRSGTIDAILGGTAGLNKTGTGTVTISSDSTYTGATTVNEGLLVFSSGSSLANLSTITVSGGELRVGNTLLVDGVTLLGGTITGTSGRALSTQRTGTEFLVQAGAISATFGGYGSLRKTTAGTVTLSGESFQDGQTIIEGGTLVLANPSGTTLDVFSGAGAVKLTTGTLKLMYNQSIYSLEGGAGGVVELFDGAAGRTLTIADFLATTTKTFSGVIQGAGGSLIKDGPGTLTLNGANTFTGTTTVASGSLVLGANGRLASQSSLVVSGGTFDLQDVFNTVTGVTLNSGTLTGTSGRLTSLTDFNLRKGTVNASLAGNVGLSKTTADTVYISAANFYTGPTSINAGTVQMGNSSGSAFGTGAVDLAGGATLRGAGGFSGSLTLHGTVSPSGPLGRGAATISTGGQMWEGGGKYNWETGSATPTIGAWDLLSISGTLTINATSANTFTIGVGSLQGSINFPLSNFDPKTNYSFTLAATTGGIFGFSADKFIIDTSAFLNGVDGGTWSLAVSGNNLNLNFTASAIPEPSTYAMIAGLAALATGWWRRRKAARRNRA